MDQERQEVYERIPWETLEKPRRDHNWLVMALAGAVAIGALAYSFVRSQPGPMPPAPSTPMVTQSQPPAPEAAVSVPVVVSEADLYAVDQALFDDQVKAHAEWVAVEYVSYDGSEQSRQTLGALLPIGVPTPEAPEGTQVFVDWARALTVTEIGPLSYRVEVLVRSLSSNADSGFSRQPPMTVAVEIALDDTGRAVAARPPEVVGVAPPEPSGLPLQPLPPELSTDLGEVVGGEPKEGGTWLAVVMVTGPDGVTRPQTVSLP